MELEELKKIFGGLQYYVIGVVADEALSILNTAGAKKHSYLSQSVKIALSDSTDDIEQYSETIEIYDIPVVSSNWVTMSKKCGKALPTKAFQPSQLPRLFTGKKFCASHLSPQDLNAVWGMITFHGGTTQKTVDETVSHLVTARLSGKKYQQAMSISTLKIVTPDWITDCIKKKELIDEINYHPKTIPSSTTLRRQLEGAKDLPGQPVGQGNPASVITPNKQAATPRSKQSASRRSAGHARMQRPQYYPPNAGMVPRQMYAAQVADNQAIPRGPLRLSQPSQGHSAPYSYPVTSGQLTPASSQASNSTVHSQPQSMPAQPNYPAPCYLPKPGQQMMMPAQQFPGQQHIQHRMPHPQRIPQPGQAPTASQGIPMTSQSPVVLPMVSQSPAAPAAKSQQPPTASRAPPLHQLGMMTEVPYPSQASVAEETPIIKMTNMAAFPMGPHTTSSQRRSPAKASLKNVTNTSSTVNESHTKTPPKVSQPQTPKSQSPGLCDAKEKSPKSAQVSTGQDNVYYGYEASENIPTDMCLIGCIFYMGDYTKSAGSQLCAQWAKAIEENGGTVDPSYSNRVTHVLVESQYSDVFTLALNDHKRVVTVYWLNDVIGQKKMQPPWQAYHVPHPHPENGKCSDQVIGITGFNAIERKKLKIMIKLMGASFTSYLARSNTALVCKRLQGDKVKKAGEWGIQCVNVAWLSDLLLGHMTALKLPLAEKYHVSNKGESFSADTSLMTAVMSGWRVPIKIPKDCWRKFKPSSKTTDGNSENKRKAEEELYNSNTKRLRLQEIQNTKSNLAKGQVPSVMMTGFTKTDKTKYTEMIVSLGGKVCSDPKDCTHLIAETIKRTPNFLLTMNHCAFITSPDWVTESMKCGHFLDEKMFSLCDGDTESMWDVDKALESRQLNGKPFAELTFYITPGVPSSVGISSKLIQQLVEGAGGHVQTNGKRWSVKKITQHPTKRDKSTYIVVTCQDDYHLCMDLVSNNIAVYSVEFITSGVICQRPAYEHTLSVTNGH